MAVFDIALFYLLNGLAGQSALLDGLIVFFASYLAYILPFLVIALVVFSRYPRRVKWELLIVAGSASIIARFGIVELIRLFYQRPRPFSVLPVEQLVANTAWSFPSGHAAFFFAMATAVYFYNRLWGALFFVAAAVIAVSRVIAGVHYPTDIIAGALIGVAVAGIVALTVRYFAEK